MLDGSHFFCLLWRSLAVFLLSLYLPFAQAFTWADPGDMELRHDLQLLNDRGLINIPLTTWPLAWKDIQRVVTAIDEVEAEAADLNDVIFRVTRKMDRALQQNRLHGGVGLSGYKNRQLLRTFEDVPREEAEVKVEGEYLYDRIAARVRVTAVDSKDIDADIRWDGSYIGGALGNWMLTLGAQDRWWGPGWDGSLIMSNNPRPIPAVALTRVSTAAPETSWLRWVGPWTFTTFMGQLEEDRIVPNALMFGARFTFKPFRSLELGLSRTALWGGDGRPQDWSTFWDMLLGRDNPGENTSLEDQPGNQLAGYDLRWNLPIKAFPSAFYTQWIGEDESDGLPSAKIHQYGIEHWGILKGKSYRVYIEYSDTAVRRDPFSNSPEYNTAYNHGLYPYRYYDRTFGHSMDSDGESWSLGIQYAHSTTSSWHFDLIYADLNRDGTGPNPVSPTAQRLVQASLSNQYWWKRHELHWGIGWQSLEEIETGEKDEEPSVFLQWAYRI